MHSRFASFRRPIRPRKEGKSIFTKATSQTTSPHCLQRRMWRQPLVLPVIGHGSNKKLHFQNSSKKYPEIKKKKRFKATKKFLSHLIDLHRWKFNFNSKDEENRKKNPHIIKNWSELLKKRNRSFSAFIATGSLTSSYIFDILYKI